MVFGAWSKTGSQVGACLPIMTEEDYENAKSERKRNWNRLGDTFWKLMPEATNLLADISERLLIGQERYGGFKFDEYDLDQMSVEEIEDFLVYIVAKYRKKLK